VVARKIAGIVLKQRDIALMLRLIKYFRLIQLLSKPTTQNQTDQADYAWGLPGEKLEITEISIQ